MFTEFLPSVDEHLSSWCKVVTSVLPYRRQVLMLSVLVCVLYDGALSLISYHTLLSVEAAVLTATSESLMWVPGVTVTTDDICT